MMERQREGNGGMPLFWFGKTLCRFTPHYADVVFPAICLRLIGPVEPVIFALSLNRGPPFQRAEFLIVVTYPGQGHNPGLVNDHETRSGKRRDVRRTAWGMA